MKHMLLIHQGAAPTRTVVGRVGEPVVGRAEGDLRREPGDQRDARRQPRPPAAAPETATTVRVENGKTLATDGRFVEIKEALGGYLFFEAEDLDAAIELAARILAARLGGAIEVRPVVERQRSSSRGELLRRLGRTAEARHAYRRALALVHDDAERRLLERRLAELGTATDPARR